ncbi:hypothetical protein [Bifidobacterium aquikefiri]|uniref:hypothetical protein n=1 Tax=Bifidobacterium aquikefiri TaxID=1653207 RepID=UPI0039EB1735
MMSFLPTYAILYAGDVQIRFSGSSEQVIPDNLGISKSGIEGWLSTPELKTTLTERASGNGAHDVSDSDILYASRTISLHWVAMGVSRDEVLEAARKVLSATGQTVRLRVVEASQDTYVQGYVQPAIDATWVEGVLTGTLTIVCPRPERLAWSPLQTQLFPVSVMQGGLQYSTTHELVSAWTGTANASSSTLSKDRNVVATNLQTDPSSKQKVGMYHAQGVQNSDGTWTYSSDGTSTTAASVFLWGSTGTATLAKGNVLFVRIKETQYIPTMGIESSSVIARGTDWVAATYNATGNATLGVINGAKTVLQVGSYTASDWQAMQSLDIDWFSGDSYPVPTGKGLSYPLKYGTAGASSNVALLLNQGSSTAFPVLTVTGSFPNGIQIQWGGNALQYDGAIGAVPLILDSRSQTASMGGVDVSRNLSRRDFPTVPAAGSVSLRLMSAGTGWVTAVCRDTYI